MNRFGDGSNGKKWGNVRKALFGTLNVKRVSADGPAGTFDTNFELLAKQFPGEFAADGDIVANVERLMQIKEASKPDDENIYGNESGPRCRQLCRAGSATMPTSRPSP